jgi:hypothetical protein
VASGATVPERYADSYRSGLTSARSLVDQRITALIADRTTPTPKFYNTWSLFTRQRDEDAAAWALGHMSRWRSDRPREVRTTAQRVVDALVPSGNWPLPARHFGELLLDRPPVLGDDQAVIVAHLDDARRR